MFWIIPTSRGFKLERSKELTNQFSVDGLVYSEKIRPLRPRERIGVDGSEEGLIKILDTANSGQKKETKAMVFHQMDTVEVSDRFVAPCFVNGLGNKVVKKELIVALRGEIYFVKFIINLEEDDVEPGVIFERSFLRMTKAITDFGAGTVTIYPEFDPFLEDIEEEEKSLDDWDHLLDFNLDDIPLLGKEELPPFICKMGTSSSAGGHLTQEEAAKEELAIRISQKFALLEELRPVIKIMDYHDKYKKILDEIWKDKLKLDGKIVKEEEEAIKRINGEALKEKDDPEAFIFPIRLEGRREEMKKVDRGITMINHTQAEAMRILINVLCQVGVTTLIAKFLILDIPIDRDAPIVVSRGFLRMIGGIVNTPERLFSTFDGFCHQTFRTSRSDVMRNAESDSDDEEEYQIKRNKFRAPIYGPKPPPYLNYNDLVERPLAIQTVTNPFQKISVWKKAVSFLGLLLVPLKHVNWKPDYKGCYTKEEEATRQWRIEIRLIDPYRNIYLQGFTTKKTDRLLSKYHKLIDIMSPNLWEHTMMRPDHQDPNALDNMKPWKRYCSHKFIMSSCYGKDATEMRSLGTTPRLAQLLPRHIYSSCIVNWDVLNRMGYDGEIDDMLRIRLLCAENELQTKKIIKFRLGGRAHSLTLLEFARRFGLYQVVEFNDEGFNVYFEGGLRSDEHFNAQEYWLSIGREENLGLSRSHTFTIKSPILRVIHKMITYGLCQRTTRKSRVLTDDVLRSLSAPIYCRDLDITTLRDLIDSEGKLIPKDPQPGVLRVGIPRPPRASMQELYDRMGRMEIRQEGAYNPPGYAQS
ncbi:hypothetical protein Tco_0817256 [Tanacetum coccineum]